MNKKIIFWGLIVMLGVNSFLLLSGIIVPWIISNDQIPIAGICLLITSMVFAAATLILCFAYKKLTKVKQ